VNGDTAVEANETFSVTLSGPANAILGTATGTGTILNDDTVAAPGLPVGAVADYAFGAITNGMFLNTVSGAAALPPLVVRGTDVRVDGGGSIWNEQIGAFTFAFPFDPARGTFAETTAFSNTFADGGTVAVRLRLDPSVPASLQQASGVGAVTFRASPDPNIHQTAPRAIEFYRDGPQEPLQLLAREGDSTQSVFNDTLKAPMPDPTSGPHVLVSVWTSTTLSGYVDGVLVGSVARTKGDYPTGMYRLLAAVAPGLIHSGDNQFFKGTIWNLMVYPRALTATEVGGLSTALGAVVLP
jgi:hypothetical protein